MKSKPDNLGPSVLICYPNGYAVRNRYHWIYNSRDICEDEWCYSEVIKVPKLYLLNDCEGDTNYSWTGKKRPTQIVNLDNPNPIGVQMLPYRSAVIPVKDKPKKCAKLFGCPKCRHAMREWKRYESFRKSFASPDKPMNTSLLLFRFSILGMLLNIGFAGLMIMNQDHGAAVKSLVGAMVWALCILIFDRNMKHGI